MRSPEETALIANIADDLAAGVWVASAPDGRFVYANRAFEEIMGMGAVPEAGLGQYAEPYGIYARTGELYPESRMPFVRALEARATVSVDDIVIHRRDGRRVFVRALAKPMFGACGEITSVTIVFYDITREVLAEAARTRAEEERASMLARELETQKRAAEMEERLHRLLSSAPVVLFAYDLDGVVTVAEGRGLARLGGDPSVFIGRSIFDLYADNPNIVRTNRRVLAGETVSTVEDLGSVVFESWLAPLRTPEGDVAGGIGVSVDVTERHRMQAQLTQSERLASVGMLAAGVAHEINNPLSYVIGNLDLMTRELARPEGELRGPVLDALHGLVRDAREGADRVRSIVRDLKMFSRVDEQPPHSIDVRAPIEASIGMAANEIRHRARLVHELAPVPAVRADEGRLGQLFLNLLINASQAIPEGAAEKNEIRVTTSVEPGPGGRVRIEVTDTGAGIAPEALPKIFDPFFTTKAVGVGTGLGLAICHAIVTELGGRIEVESVLGRGSTFRVLLRPAEDAPEAALLPARAPASTAKRGSVLVVDDEPLILSIVERLLAPEHDVTCEERAASALARIERGERYDAILCDLMMPDMTGMDLYERLLALAPAQARTMLFLTGGAFTTRAQEFLERVPNATIEKPFRAEVLGSRVRQLVG